MLTEIIRSTLILFLFTLFACDKPNKNSVDKKTKRFHTDSVYIDSNEINGAGGQSYKEFNK